MAADGPTPAQQADYLVRKLEQTIRDNRGADNAKGMSFRTWQAIAREEITNALSAAEKRQRDHDRTINRVLLVGASALVSIGFWGAVVAVDRSYGTVAAAVALVAGAALLFLAMDVGLKRAGGDWARRRRAERLTNIEDLDRRIKRMEDALTRKEKRLRDKMEEIGPL